jgi:two-component sensor histidine kinase
MNKYEMVIKDNGIGLPEGFDLNNTSTLGLNIVNALVKQLNGSIETLKTNGTAFRIIFNEK